MPAPDFDHRVAELLEAGIGGPLGARNHHNLLDRGDDPDQQERLGDELALPQRRADRAEQFDENEYEEQFRQQRGRGRRHVVAEVFDEGAGGVDEDQRGSRNKDHRHDPIEDHLGDPEPPISPLVPLLGHRWMVPSLGRR